MTTQTQKPMLNISAEFTDMNKMYLNASASETLSCMLLGPMGTGKTVALATAPRPLVIDSFDPGGTKSILSIIKEEGGIYPTLYESDEMEKPFAFVNWMNEFNRRHAAGFFDHVGTYAIDSFTNFYEAALMYAKQIAVDDLKKIRYRGMPDLGDYRIMGILVTQFLKKIMTLPCNFVLIGHVSKEKDLLTGKYVTSIVANPNLQEKVPACFDEVYMMDVDEKKPMDQRYRFLTDIEGMYACRSRMAGIKHLLNKYEPANFKHILKKVNLPYEDKIITKG